MDERRLCERRKIGSQGSVETVLGPVPPASLGATLPHDHLLLDFQWVTSSSAVAASDRDLWEQPITLENRYEAARHLFSHGETLRLTNVETAIDEASHYRRAGGGCIVDVTSLGLARDPGGLQRVSRGAGIHVVMGAGYYVHESHPPHLDTQTEEEVYEDILRDVNDGVDGVRPGIIGEIGLTWPLHPRERKVLVAAAKAQARTGLALTIHPGRHPSAPREALAIVKGAGGDLTRTVMGHLDRTIFDMDGFLEVARSGCYLEFDLFGQESSFYELAPIDMPNDAVRVDYLIRLAEHGYRDRLLASTDVCDKVSLKKYGGPGYDHILSHVVPLMRRKGMSLGDIDQILVRNPAEMLTIR